MQESEGASSGNTPANADASAMGPYSGREVEYIYPERGEFNPKYQRNNKKGGVKNLRCFPKCLNFPTCKGHPCARSVAVRLVCPASALAGVSHLEIRDHILVYARFRATDEDEMPENLLHFTPGSVYPKMRAVLGDRIRTKTRPPEIFSRAL